MSRKSKIYLTIISALLINGYLVYSMVNKPTPISNTKDKQTIALPASSKQAAKTRPTPIPLLASYSLAPAQAELNLNETADFDIIINTKFPLAGADAVLTFDPEKIQIIKIDKSNDLDISKEKTIICSNLRLLR